VHTILGDGSLGTLWIYVVGPLLGAVVAAGAFAIQGEE
jgi:glycerol uptake facilitator-like aquaporin